MLRMYVVQQCFGLSDEGMEDAIYDSQAIRRFIGIDLSREAAPDATTLLKFRCFLETQHLTKTMFGRAYGFSLSWLQIPAFVHLAAAIFLNLAFISHC